MRAAVILVALALLLVTCTKSNNPERPPTYFVPPTSSEA